MSYADLLSQSPKSNRTSHDRFMLSSPSSPQVKSVPINKSKTPDRNIFRYSSLMRSPKRCLSSTRLFFNSSSTSSFCEIYNSPSNSRNERRNQIPLSNSNSSTNLSNSRIYPKKPNVKFSIEPKLIPTDFYISPITWSKKGIIITVLNHGIIRMFYPKLNDYKDIKNEEISDSVSVAVNNHSDGKTAAIGCAEGQLSLLDISSEKIESEFDLFDSAVMTSDWNSSDVIISGGKGGFFSVLDVRSANYSRYDQFFSEDICGIKYNSINPNIFAVSSIEGNLKIFDMRNLERYISKYSEHNSAVRAIEFSPNEENIIITGGGTLDKTIRMWNIFSGETCKVINTNSQVCNLYWNKEYNEIISTHGFSQNHIAIWKGNDFSLIHQYFENYNRVLYMTHSFDETKIATLVPSEGIDIWNLFPEQRLSLMSTISELR